MLDGEGKLIARAIRGEASAFGSLYDHYQPKIYRFIAVKVSRREDAEDLTHQVFLNAWRNIKGYEDLGFPFSSWLYRIARNQIIDHYRTLKKNVGLEEIDNDPVFSQPSPERETEKELSNEEVTAAIRLLKQDYQDVIIMRFVEEFSIKEVAAALGRSEGAVKLLQHRAIKSLKDVIFKK